MNRLGLVGNPENRRVRDFQQAVVDLGLPRPPCLSWAELLRDPGALERFPADILRLDSPGENEEVTQLLAGRRLEFGEVARLREVHQAFCRALEQIRHPCLNAPSEVAVMFDKQACHERFVAHGVPRPPTSDELLRAPHGRVFLKPLHGSSASGVCALRWTPARRELFAPLRIEGTRLFNCLKVQRYTERAEIDLILGRLLPQGMICEQWIPKLTLADGVVDLRVLVIAGEARHRVVRQSRHPMTNLHLGNRRGDLEELTAVIGPERLEAACRLAEKAAACFPGSLYAGVDILVDTSHRAWVGEINAFGDLLPGLTHRGESAYTAIARAAWRSRRPPRTAIWPIPRAVLFDLDNTLIDRDGALRECLREEFPPQTVSKLLAVDARGYGPLLAAWPGMTQEELGKRLAARLRPRPGLREALAGLRRRVKVGILSNGGSATQRAKLRAAGLDLEQVWISGEVGCAKPDPAIFRLACAQLGEEPDRCLYVGDHEPTDRPGAEAAGLRFFCVDRVLDGAALRALFP